MHGHETWVAIQEESFLMMEDKRKCQIPTIRSLCMNHVEISTIRGQDMNGKKMEKEEIEDVAKESDDVSFEAPFLYEESMPYVPPIACPCHLHKSNWYRMFSKLSKLIFQVHIYLPLLAVIRNTLIRTKYFQDLFSSRRIFEALEFG
ncbi:hypothetical protein QYF36_008768 [Acer negundo]|nr:hypothetical protein QYF36_008768 [Acer negundo]